MYYRIPLYKKLDLCLFEYLGVIIDVSRFMPRFLKILSPLWLGFLISCDLAEMDLDNIDFDKWPQQPIQIACFSSAGGGTDTVSRLIASAMEPELGVKINVINRTGARGGAALNYVWRQKRDGYHWGGFSESIIPAPVMGVHTTSSRDWTYFMVAGAPGVISVQTNSKWKSLNDFIEYAKNHPGEIKVAASSTGGIWHTKMLALQNAAGVKFQYMPFQGSRKSITATLTGEVDAVLTSISEQSELIRSQKLLPLAMIEPEDFEFPDYGMIQSAAHEFPGINDVPIKQWLGFALPADTPTPILEKITSAFESAIENESIQEFAQTRMLEIYGFHGQRSQNIASYGERVWTWMLDDLGVTVRSPNAFGIARPE